MASGWSDIDSQFPTFTGSERPEEQIAKLQNYLYLLTQQLKYMLANLNAENFNTDALAGIQSDATAGADKEIRILQGQVRQLSGGLQAVGIQVANLGQLSSDLQAQIEENTVGLNGAKGDLSRIQKYIKVSDDVTIGAENVDVRLVGNVTINGTPAGG